MVLSYCHIGQGNKLKAVIEDGIDWNGDMCKRICVWISNASPENTHTSILLKAFRCPDLVQYLHLLDYLVV